MADSLSPTEHAAVPEGVGAPATAATFTPEDVVGGVVARMDALLAPLDRHDGVACFLRLYRTVTADVQKDLGGQTFADRPFMAKLDDTFAGLFLNAAEAYAKNEPHAPKAWAPLFELRSHKGIAPLQFALAGMNAHINRDLPVALVTTFRDAGVSLAAGTPQHADYVRINQVLAAVEARVKQQYLGGWLSRADRLLHRIHRIDDVVAMWDIARARAAAWTNAEALWAVRDGPLYDELLGTIDRTVGFAGRGLLIPADSGLKRVARALHLL